MHLGGEGISRFSAAHQGSGLSGNTLQPAMGVPRLGPFPGQQHQARLPPGAQQLRLRFRHFAETTVLHATPALLTVAGAGKAWASSCRRRDSRMPDWPGLLANALGSGQKLFPAHAGWRWTYSNVRLALGVDLLSGSTRVMDSGPAGQDALNHLVQCVSQNLEFSLDS